MISKSGSPKGQWRIRINDQYRLCFKWQDGEVHDLEFVDHHCDEHKEPEKMAKRKIALVTPGEVLRNDFPAPMGISAYRLAADTGMTQTRSIASTWH